MPKVSIIIPFNNVENYVEECLNTVVNQTLKDIEIILINDASTDSSRDKVLKFVNSDNRIKLLDINERKGQGYARNRGIEVARGDYIGFVDSDDFVELDMFETLYKNAVLNNLDITMCQVKEYDDLNAKYILSDYYSLSILSTMEDKVFSAEDTKDRILDINVALWNKIYKREYLNELNEKFPEGFIYEDLPFFFGTYLKAKRIQIIWKYLYNYRINRKNSTMQQFNNKILDRAPMVSLTYEKLKKIPFLKDMQQKIQGWIINDLFHRYTLLKESYHKEFFFLMKKVFENLNIKDTNNPYWRRVYHFRGYLLTINNTFEDFNQKVFAQYLDLHKMEERLRSEMSNEQDIDRRFNLIYSDLDKNYKYTEYIVSSRTKELYNDIKDLSYVFNDSIGEFRNSLNNMSGEELKIQESIKNIQMDLDKKVSNLQKEYKKEIDNKISFYMKELKEDIEKNQIKTDTIIKELMIETKTLIEQQKIKHDEEIIDIKNQILQMESTLREEMKSPLKKFIENHKNKQEK